MGILIQFEKFSTFFARSIDERKTFFRVDHSINFSDSGGLEGIVHVETSSLKISANFRGIRLFRFQRKDEDT